MFSLKKIARKGLITLYYAEMPSSCIRQIDKLSAILTVSQLISPAAVQCNSPEKMTRDAEFWGFVDASLA